MRLYRMGWRCLLALLLLGCGAATSAPLPTIISSTATPTTIPAPSPTPATPTREPTPTVATLAVSVTRDVTYTISLQANVDTETLDIYAPLEQKAWPVVVFAHGFGERKADYQRFSRSVAEQGAIVFTLDWPARNLGVRDNGRALRQVYETMACAVRFANARTSNAPRAPRVVVIGFSAGAAAMSYVALAGDAPDRLWDELATARGGPPRQLKCVADAGALRIEAFVGVAGPYGLAAAIQQSDAPLWRAISPYAYLDKKSNVKIRLLHGTFDSTVPLEQSVQFHEALIKAGFDATLTQFDKGHAVPPELAIEVLKGLW